MLGALSRPKYHSFGGDSSDVSFPFDGREHSGDCESRIMTDAAVKDTFISMDMDDNKNIFTSYTAEVYYFYEMEYIYNLAWC